MAAFAQAIRVGILARVDVFEGDSADFERERAGLRVQRLESRILDLVIAEHLLDGSSESDHAYL